MPWELGQTLSKTMCAGNPFSDSGTLSFRSPQTSRPQSPELQVRKRPKVRSQGCYGLASWSAGSTPQSRRCTSTLKQASHCWAAVNVCCGHGTWLCLRLYEALILGQFQDKVLESCQQASLFSWKFCYSYLHNNLAWGQRSFGPLVGVRPVGHSAYSIVPWPKGICFGPPQPEWSNQIFRALQHVWQLFDI